MYLGTGFEVNVPDSFIEQETEMDLLDTPESVAEKEGIHERIQSEMLNADKEKISQEEEMLEIPPVWNKVKDLIMDDRDTLPEDLRLENRKRDEVARGLRKRRNKEDIRADKRMHSPTKSRRIHPPQGFYAENWTEDQQEEDNYQIPDKFQRIWCLSTESKRFLQPRTESSLVSMFNTKEADVAYSRYMDTWVTPYKIGTSTCLRSRWAKKIIMIIFICC